MHKHLPHTLKIGSQSIAVRDLADASFAYQDARDKSPNLPTGSITIGGIEYQVGYTGVFHNGTRIMEAQ